MQGQQITSLARRAPTKLVGKLAQKAYQTKCGIINAMYPQQKYAHDQRRIKKKLDEMSPAEQIKYICEHAELKKMKEDSHKYTKLVPKVTVLAQSS